MDNHLAEYCKRNCFAFHGSKLASGLSTEVSSISAKTKYCTASAIAGNEE